MGMFPGRTPNKVAKKARSIGVKWKMKKIASENTWTKEEDEILQRHAGSKEQLISLLPNRDWLNIYQRLRKRDLNVIEREKWTDEEDALIRKLYEGTPSDLVNLKELLANRSWTAVKLRARRLGLFVDVVALHRESRSEALLSDSPEALYWLGFLFADGHFGNSDRIHLKLAVKDAAHVEKFADFVSCKNIHLIDRKHPAVGVAFQDKNVVAKIKHRFKISSTKTYNPPDTSCLTCEQLAILLIGFIDGDGSILNRIDGGFSGGIKCHSSWLPTFRDWYRVLTEANILDEGSQPRINAGYVQWYQCAEQLRQLKSVAMEHKLPVLSRKWNLVVDAKRKPLLTNEQIEEIRNSTAKMSEDASKYKVSYQTIYAIRKGKRYLS